MMRLGRHDGYDTAGQITGQVERVGGQTIVRTYAYDAAGRLSQTWSNGVPHATYRYDANGNRTNAVVGGIAKTGQYDAQDRLLAYGAATYQYDAHGTLTNKTDGGQSTAYRYDARGSLLQVGPGTNVIAYSVDALGRRIARTKNGTTAQRLVYQGFLAPIAELNADGSVASRFVYATRANVPDYMVRSGTTYRLVTDIRGSVRLVVNAANGSVAQRLDYDEWGRVLQDTNPGFQPFGFAGGLYDPDTGLVRFGYRDYDPDTGRWLAKDPILFAGGQANLYLYCGGDPVNWIDPMGLSEDSYNWDEMVWWEKFGMGYYYGTGYGQNALEYYANIIVDPNTPWYKKGAAYIGAGFSALWTPETYQKTGWTLINAVGYAKGIEFKFGKNIRIAPWGNRTGNPKGELPHFHKRVIDPATGATKPGGGIGWHRPWE